MGLIVFVFVRFAIAFRLRRLRIKVHAPKRNHTSALASPSLRVSTYLLFRNDEASLNIDLIVFAMTALFKVEKFIKWN